MSTPGSTGTRGNRGDGRGRGRGRAWPQGRGQGQDRGQGRGRGSPAPFSPPVEGRGGFRGRGVRGSDTGGPAGGSRGFRGGFSRGAPGHGPGGPVPSLPQDIGPVTIPPRLSDQSLQDLIRRFRSASVTSGPKRPLRPGYGTKGTAIKVQANFFPIKLPKGPFFDYAVTMTPKPRSAWERKQIFKSLVVSQEMVQYRPHIAHDNTQRLVSARALPEGLTINIPFHEDEDEPTVKSTMYTISIAKTEMGELDLNLIKDFIAGKPEAREKDMQPLVGALDLILQQHASQEGFRVGKNRFFIPSKAERYSLGPGIEAFQGFYLSVRPAYKELLVNVNVAVTAFFQPGNLADALKTFGLRSSGASLTLPDGFGERIKITVKTRHLGHRKKIKSIATTSARRTKFLNHEGKPTTVEDHFRKAHNITLRHPDDVPVVDLSGPNSQNPQWVPAELCDIPPGQPLFDLSESHTAQMIRFACNPPGTNRNSILNKGLPSLGLAPRLPPIDGFGVEVVNEFSTVPARELAPPAVTYSPARPARVNEASWNFMGERFHKGASVTSWWVVVVLDSRGRSTGIQDPRIRDLVTEFALKCRNSGMNISSTGAGSPEYMEISLPRQGRDQRDRKNAVELVRNRFRDKLPIGGRKPSFALVLLENKDSHIYPAIKRIGDVELGLQTVHILLDKLFSNRRHDQYYSNVALKVNTKLGGINHKLDAPAMAWLRKKPTMMVGIDVTHPGVRAKYGSPSIAAVVANSDDDFVQFPGSIRIQEGRKEMVLQLKEMMIERLQAYERKNKKLPERVFVFRDGVSEGQFNEVNREELPQILEAFASFPSKPGKPAYGPKLSIVICGKRHHARFYPTSSQNATRNGNTRPGTVVDQGVTAVFDFDFYLQAHAGIQGHVKATHYTVIYDENAFGADEIQQGTHHASYMYARASKAVSLIPPAYYADLACERGRCYLNEFLSFEDPEKNKGKGKGKDRGRDAEKERVFGLAERYWGQGLHPDMKDTMFYI